MHQLKTDLAGFFAEFQPGVIVTHRCWIGQQHHVAFREDFAVTCEIACNKGWSIHHINLVIASIRWSASSLRVRRRRLTFRLR